MLVELTSLGISQMSYDMLTEYSNGVIHGYSDCFWPPNTMFMPVIEAYQRGFEDGKFWRTE